MKVKVPFVKGLKKWKGNGWCGPIALASILRYYKDKSSVEDVSRKSGSLKKNGGGTSPEGLVFFCLSKGFHVDYIKKYKTFSYNRKEFSKEYKNFLMKVGLKELEKKFIKRCKKFPNYKEILRNPTIKDIEKYVNQKKPVLLYLNIAVPYKIDKLWPHYVAVVGYDKNNFYVHNIYPKNTPYQKIPKKVFMEAWKSQGMGDCIIIPYKKT
jgi:hypothetical protein